MSRKEPEFFNRCREGCVATTVIQTESYRFVLFQSLYFGGPFSNIIPDANRRRALNDQLRLAEATGQAEASLA
jgi:hypothetical protein